MAGLMHELGFDEDGDEHILFGGDPDQHEPSSSCGCNPDPYHDENPYDYGRRPVKWWWDHHA